jgi:hypothetical protein
MFQAALKSQVHHATTRTAATVAAQPVVPRRYPLIFKLGTDADDVARTITMWNEYFREHFEGVGYFHSIPKFEEHDGEVMECYYLHSDLAFHNDFMGRQESIAPHIEAVVMEGGVELEASFA